MLNWYINRLQRKFDRQEQERDEKRKLEQKLIGLGAELKDALIKAGIHPFSRMNRNFEDEYIFMYGILDKRIVKATMTVKGAFLIEYVSYAKTA